jgi:hypothetical protein
MFINQNEKPQRPLPDPVAVSIVIIFIMFLGALILITIFK